LLQLFEEHAEANAGEYRDGQAEVIGNADGEGGERACDESGEDGGAIFEGGDD